MIKNIIFDMGKVLLQFEPQVSLDTYCDSEEEKALIYKELFEGPEWIMGDEGKITNGQRYELVAKRIPGELHRKLKLIVENWEMCMEPVPKAKDFCDDVKKQGYRLFVLSNACNRFYNYFSKNYDLNMFQGIVVSSDIKMIKPDLKIYQYICDTYQLDPAECLFIDDREENVEAAKQAGMQSVVFRENFDEIKKRYNL